MMAYSNPVVSIITPSYSQGQFIEETILSVKSQDYSNIEHIIVDGGSTDGTLEILRKYQHTYNMRWISEPDAGQADAIEKGFRAAQGDFLCWLNSDDIYVSRNAVRQAALLFQEYPQADVITGGGVLIDENSHWIQLIETSQNRACYKHLRYVDSILQPATFLRRRVLDSVQLDKSLHYAFDWDFFIQLSKECNILAVNQIWAGYRMWGYNKTTLGGAVRAKELLEVTERYLGRRSWQYWMVGIFVLQYRLAEQLPKPLRSPLKILISKASTVLSFASNTRFTSV